MLTPAARDWLRLLHEPQVVADECALPPAVLAAVAAVRRANSQAGVRLTVHTVSGGWLELHAARADGGPPARWR